MLAPAIRHQAPLTPSHACFSCEVRTRAVCGVLDCDTLARLRRLRSNFSLNAGQPLFHQGDLARRVFTLTKGSLKLYKLLPDGRRQVTGFMYPGDFLGIGITEEQAFTAEALEQSQLCAFPQPLFDEVTAEHAEMERELYRLAAHELAAAKDHIVLLGRKTAVERFATFLLMLAERAERNAGQEMRFVDLPMSRSDIADYLGLTKETVSRVLAILKRQRLIRLEALNRIEILDRATLKSAADGVGGEV